ncbi:Stk1 family PASTA domain-containing Ser/Thr kinase [Nocardioides sp. T2.26MG-1]|uniref:Stk1 family PASTA domain-containing Ser/Thr kinase n=1 Tax=Nocardioides sp. T2.26MG-1 TaxID=3041166 RepID=UPI0024773293|nr:Stk1 family PASTA domain-containing Ser/Thr kinase [Nocardioides sp. T2.26MG-1]CAI9402506.1 Serine/threonine-protein kinase PknB [Nocardioides sp. T2.26MG-1]
MSNHQPTVVGGRYELGELLGRGGMAEVRKGTDARLGRVVAVKRLRTDLASDATFQARFRREAQSAASLNHPAIAAVYDTGEEPAADGSGISQPYIVMEFVAGRTLRDILREGRKILPERALEITSGVLAALDYSHRAGIIHRDIKPGNVMLTPSGDVKVMDFGIARAISDASSTMTQTAAVVGTAQYLSPEQARGETVDSRSDVYSAGCLLYELLTGRPPFVGDSPVAVAYQHVREPAVPPSDHDTELPPEIDAIVMKALAKRVEDRYQSAAAMRSDIERYLAGRPVQAPIPAPVAVPATPSYATAPTAVVGAVPPGDDELPRSRTGLLVLIGVLLVALLLAGAFFVWPKLFPSAPEQVPVPDLVGKTEPQARRLIGDAGLTVGSIDQENSDTVKAGQIIRQSPEADDFVDPDTAVAFVVSLGEAQVAMPSVIGSDKDAARAELAGDPYRFVVKLREDDSDEPAGQVIRQEPEANTQLDPGSEVTLFYSDGPEEVPGVVGLLQGAAKTKIRAAGFEPEVIENPNSTEPAGTVISQSPQGGTPADQGATVTIVVSTYAPTEPTESPTTSPTDQPTESPSPLLRDRAAPPASLSSRTPGRAGRRS